MVRTNARGGDQSRPAYIGLTAQSVENGRVLDMPLVLTDTGTNTGTNTGTGTGLKKVLLHIDCKALIGLH